VFGPYSAIIGGRGLTIDAPRTVGFHANSPAGDRNMTIADTAIALFGNTDLWLANNDNNPSELRFFEAYNTAGAFPNTANYTAFKAQTQTGDITYTLPASNGAAGQVLAVAAAPAPTATTATLEWVGNGATIVNTTNSTNTSGGAFSADQDDLSLSSTASFFRIATSVGAGIDITGIAAGVDGRQIVVCNIGANNITLKHQDGNSLVANRFQMPGGGDITLGPDGTATLIYDATSGFWRLVSTN
jgi:hypothetical protein